MPKLDNTPSTGLDRVVLGVVDAGLFATLAVAPLFMGGRHPLGEFIFVSLSVVVASAWMIRQCVLPQGVWRRSAIEWIMLAAVCLLVFQMAPLPESLLHKLSPAIQQLLPLWSSPAEPGDLGTWNTISLVPASTRGALVVLLSYGLLLLTTIQRIEKLADIERILRWMAIAAVSLATIAILQYMSGTEKFLWIYEFPHRRPIDGGMGTFINKNHFAHMMALGVGPLLWWLVEASRESNTKNSGFAASESRTLTIGLAAAGCSIVLFASLLSMSRGGLIAVAVAAVCCVTLMFRAGVVGKKVAACLAGLVLFIAAALSIHGSYEIAKTIDDYSSIDRLDGSSARRRVWTATMAGIQQFPIVGTGGGTYREIYSLYMPERDLTESTHAENGYLQIALEAGAAGVLLLLILFGVVAYWCASAYRRSESRRMRACICAVVSGLAASAVHSAVDFVWYVPACMATTVLLIACSARLWRLSTPAASPIIPSVRLNRGWAMAASAATVLLGAWMVADRFGPMMAAPSWDAFYKLRVANRDKWSKLDLAKTDDLAGELNDATSVMLKHLENVVAWCPDNSRAQIRLATYRVRQFEFAQRTSINAISLPHLADAVLKSNFSSKDQLDNWLRVAVGPHHTLLDQALASSHRALDLCPLHGSGYLHLDSLSFLRGEARSLRKAYLEQALHVSPYDGEVLIAVGREAGFEKNVQKLVECWRKAFLLPGEHQAQMVDSLATTGTSVGAALGQSPHAVVETIFREYSLDVAATRALYARYRGLGLKDHAGEVLPYYAKAVEQKMPESTGEELLALLGEQQQIMAEMGRLPEAVASCRRAAELFPNHYETRLQLGLRLRDAGQFADAEQQIAWCSARKPGDQGVRELLQTVARMRIDSETKSASGTGASIYW